MENKKIKLIIIIIIVIILSIISFILYKKIMTDKNTENFENYLIKEGYESSDKKIYTKNVNIDDYTIEYIFDKGSFVLSKNITYNDGSTLTLIYNSNNNIESSIEHYGINKSGEYVSSIQNGTYDVKKQKFKCKIILDKGLSSKCSTLKEESKTFSKEVNNILLKSNTKAKYIKSE